MLVALLTTFAASRKEPLGEVLERVRAAMAAANLGEPQVQFALSDSPIGGDVSSVDRMLQRFPQLQALVQNIPAYPGGPAMRTITNRSGTGVIGEAVDFTTLLEIVRGVPKSFPFHSVAMHLSIPVFSGGAELPTGSGALLPGIDLRDAWWINGRHRSLTALTIVEAGPNARKLPALSETIVRMFAACGKARKTVQVALSTEPAPQAPQVPTGPDVSRSMRALVDDYRTRMAEIVERAQLPHDLPANLEARTSTPVGTTSGPKKGALVRAFTPMGYDCRGESGTFTLRRQTQGHLTAELYLDVGSWSNSVTAMFHVRGLANGSGFKATLMLPIALRAMVGLQYPIGGPERWQQIVENLAALVAELDRSFVPAVEAASGPAPAWYQPETSNVAHA